MNIDTSNTTKPTPTIVPMLIPIVSYLPILEYAGWCSSNKSTLTRLGIDNEGNN